MFYMEERHNHGWTPVVTRERPTLDKRGRIKRVSGSGPVIRNLKELPTHQHGTSLSVLQSQYGGERA